MSDDAPDWTTLGNLLVARRVQINPVYRNRRRFVADTAGGSPDSWYRMITSIETGARDNYSRETIAAMEVAYQLEPGSLTRSVRTQQLEPKRQEAMVRPGGPGGETHTPEPPASVIERQVLEDLRAAAQGRGRSIGDILVERGLARPEELTLSEEKKGDRLVEDILASDLPEDTKNLLLKDYADRRRHHYIERGLIEDPDSGEKK
ncbi:hypothetical protein, partial [Nonomuraea sp. NPDC049709]|uniref:hypothetical protein n=1 Tax=Nonomuraea sp. NPDC049709 TaxID=3154736 RepID=UPI00343A93F7